MGDLGADGKLFSVVLVAYGDFSAYSTRALDSLARTPSLGNLCEVHVGCNACCPETLAVVRKYRDAGLITTVIESRRNIHKDPMLRLLRETVRTPYILMMDDDSYAKSGWAEALVQFIRREDPFDLAGWVHQFPRSDRYRTMVQSRPWWRGDAYVPDEQKTWIRMCVGGLCLARTELLLRHDFPDRDMVIEFDDVMLSDLVYHIGGRLCAMPDDLLAHFVINDGDRRWEPADSPHKSPAHLPRQVTAAEAIQIGVRQFRAGRFAEAEDACNKVLQLDPNNPRAIHLLGVIAHQTGRNTLAVNLLKRAIALKGDVPDFHNNLGNILAKLGRFEESVECFQQAIRLRADYPEAHNNLANVRSRMGQIEPAMAGYRRAAALKPDYVEAHTNLGNLLRRLGRFDEVAECFRRAVQIDPKNAEAHNALALTYQDQGDLDQALATIDRAIALNGDNSRLRFNRALMLLIRGNWEEGWREYEWRWRLADHNADRLRFQGPAWEGDDPEGRTILLHCEQGLGSTFQFIRFASRVAQRTAKVIVECQPPLKKILMCSLPGIPVLAKGESLPSFDLHLPLMSLPRVLKTDLSSIPADIPYLRADEKLVEYWRKELSSERSFKVGIAWQGNPAYAADQQRSIPLTHYAAFAQVPGVKLYSLQKVRGMEQIASAGAAGWLVDLAPRLDESTGPFMDTAAVIKNLDLIITSDTSIAHLAGALGAKVWVALTYAADWRWMLKREDCPWYPKNMRLFRQSRPSDWPGVISRIAAALATEVQRRRA